MGSAERLVRVCLKGGWNKVVKNVEGSKAARQEFERDRERQRERGKEREGEEGREITKEERGQKSG